ncbi:MAG: helix-turn-helix domain-containing protein [Candidatus Lindowbacteria bacterium]|nr:helix-turn-helix domain-containing protein [Candidatus Lindowbacteria bacterium]
MTVREAAEYLGVSEPTIFRWMRDGTLSFFKLGGATRFRRENLDLVARKVTGKEEGKHRAERCAVCGHGFLLPGDVRSTGKIYFKPRKTKFMVLSESVVNVDAKACPICGHVEMFADVSKLAKLMRVEDKQVSDNADDEPTESS